MMIVKMTIESHKTRSTNCDFMMPSFVFLHYGDATEYEKILIVECGVSFLWNIYSMTF
jgi:hypothetical protein